MIIVFLPSDLLHEKRCVWKILTPTPIPRHTWVRAGLRMSRTRWLLPSLVASLFSVVLFRHFSTASVKHDWSFFREVGLLKQSKICLPPSFVCRCTWPSYRDHQVSWKFDEASRRNEVVISVWNVSYIYITSMCVYVCLYARAGVCRRNTIARVYNTFCFIDSRWIY
jgi:hypothetical protein